MHNTGQNSPTCINYSISKMCPGYMSNHSYTFQVLLLLLVSDHNIHMSLNFFTVTQVFLVVYENNQYSLKEQELQLYNMSQSPWD